MASVLYADNELLGEPTIEELLAEPIVRLIMKRDGVKEIDMRGAIDRVRSSYQRLIESQ